jgi:ADP-ribosylation factor related protein 1
MIPTDEVINSPRLLNLPLLLLANKQDSPSSLSVAEVRESFDAWNRARSAKTAEEGGWARRDKGKGKATADDESEEGAVHDGESGVGVGEGESEGERSTLVGGTVRGEGETWDDGGAREERLASLDVMGVSALEG